MLCALALAGCAGALGSLCKEETLPAPGCPKHLFIDLKSQFNSTRVSVRYFQITHSGQLFAAEVDRSAL